MKIMNVPWIQLRNGGRPPLWRSKLCNNIRADLFRRNIATSALGAIGRWMQRETGCEKVLLPPMSVRKESKLSIHPHWVNIFGLIFFLSDFLIFWFPSGGFLFWLVLLGCAAWFKKPHSKSPKSPSKSQKSSSKSSKSQKSSSKSSKTSKSSQKSSK